MGMPVNNRQKTGKKHRNVADLAGHLAGIVLRRAISVLSGARGAEGAGDQSGEVNAHGRGGKARRRGARQDELAAEGRPETPPDAQGQEAGLPGQSLPQGALHGRQPAGSAPEGYADTQNGASEWLLGMKAITPAIDGRSVFYVLPPFQLASRFVKNRGDRTIEFTAYYTEVLRARSLSNIPKAESLLEQYPRIADGNSNDLFRYFATGMIRAGYPYGELHRIITEIVDRSPLYSVDHELQADPGRIAERLSSLYRNYDPSKHGHGVDLTERITENVFSEIKDQFNYQRHKAARQFIKRLVQWYQYSYDRPERIKAEYTFSFEKRAAQGYYPLAYAYLEKINKRHYEILPALLDWGFLSVYEEDSGRTYEYYPLPGIRGFCRYYKVNLARFTGGGTTLS